MGSLYVWILINLSLFTNNNYKLLVLFIEKKEKKKVQKNRFLHWQKNMLELTKMYFWASWREEKVLVLCH